MHIKRFLIVLAMILTGSACLHAQDKKSDAEQLIGEWAVEKVETQLFAQQQGNRLLETKTYTAAADMRNINAFVPLNIRLHEQECTVETSAGTEKGRYLLKEHNILQYLQEDLQRQVQQQFQQQLSPEELTAMAGMECSYSLQGSGALVLKMPAVFYNDNNRNLAVKLVCTCYYRKKSTRQ